MEITMEMVKKLREETHAGIMDCKKALAQSNGDFAGAAKYLKEVGLAAVEKRADRATEEGRITFGITDKKAAIISVTCETDFVAKNEQFAKLGQDLCDLVIAKGYKEVTPDMTDMVKDLIATIHENMNIKKMDTVDVAEDENVAGYSHANGAIGVIVKFKAKDAAIFKTDAYKTFAFNTAMHVCAADPLYLDSASVPKEYEEENLSIFRTKVAQDEKLASKPDQVKEGIVKGMLKKHYAEICLMDQVCQIYNEDGLTVAQLVAKFNKDNGCDIAIADYRRFRAGA
ncbi:MAG: translation elongation factor Ts [Sphaerochaetaceae bacterium]|nr:translation elongation factor Ts [Sphaerochaetaceae bacterium]